MIEDLSASAAGPSGRSPSSAPLPLRPRQAYFPQRHVVRASCITVSEDGSSIAYRRGRGELRFAVGQGVNEVHAAVWRDPSPSTGPRGCFDLRDRSGDTLARIPVDLWLPEGFLVCPDWWTENEVLHEQRKRTGLEHALRVAPVEMVFTEATARPPRTPLVLDPFSRLDRKMVAPRIAATLVSTSALVLAFVLNELWLLSVGVLALAGGFLAESAPWLIGWLRERQTSRLLPSPQVRPRPSVPTRRAHVERAFIAATADSVVLVDDFDGEVWLPRTGPDGVTALALPASDSPDVDDEAVYLTTSDGRIRAVIPVRFWFGAGFGGLRAWAAESGLATTSTPADILDRQATGLSMAPTRPGFEAFRSLRQGLPSAGIGQALSGGVGSSYIALVGLTAATSLAAWLTRDTGVGVAGLLLLGAAVVPRIVQMVFRRYWDTVVPPPSSGSH